ncbi:hypothetical protein [uncultured Veillonella sp.]|uniref:hypothetical protein n=1 Tax=uncultured Veillonella sp. TaxID=159268 RepID=UPI0025DBD24D|nr:hypothetical protein [uncultured Veillonella sp.]
MENNKNNLLEGQSKSIHSHEQHGMSIDQDINVTVEDIVAANNAIFESAAHNDRLNRFNGHQGHGFAAEQANHQIDIIKGREALILGDDNAKNGADRMVDGQLIQTKYCQTAAESVNAGFRDGVYRYLDASGKPMQLEVPLDQYDEAVKLMADKIRKGQVPKTKNPDDAVKLVRKGNVTLQQARNIAKAGNIDSIMFDASSGAVIGLSAAGIAGSITLARALWNGQAIEKALDLTIYSGLQAGGIAFTSSILTAQLTRTSINNALMQPSVALVKLLPSNVRQYLVNSMRTNAPIYGSAATKNLAKLVRGNIIASAVTVVVLSSGDIYQYFNGKISGKQLFKNISVLGTSVAVGGAVGLAVVGVPALAGAAPYLAAIIGGAAGIVSGAGGKKILDSFIEDDAIEMVRIINKCFIPLVQDYLLSEEEMKLVVDDLKVVLGNNVLLAMFASANREQYANDLLIKLIEHTISWRTKIRVPSQEAFTHSIGRVLGTALDGGDLERLLMPEKIDTVELGKQLLNTELPEHSANKAWYVTKQMNLTLMQGEITLQRMLKNEKLFEEEHQKSLERIEDYKKEINQLMRRN